MGRCAASRRGKSDSGLGGVVVVEKTRSGHLVFNDSEKSGHGITDLNVCLFLACVIRSAHEGR
jgi:hypothetical protein